MQQLKKPRALVCYICGKEYGTKRISNHIATCAVKWDADQRETHPDQPELRKPCPQAPPGFNNVIRLALGQEPIQDADELKLPTQRRQSVDSPVDPHCVIEPSFDQLPESAVDVPVFEEAELVQCPHCARTFLPARLQIHLRSCKADRPLKVKKPAKDAPQKRTKLTSQPKQARGIGSAQKPSQNARALTERRPRTSQAIDTESPKQENTVRQRKKSVHFPQEIESPIDTQSEESTKQLFSEEQPFEIARAVEPKAVQVPGGLNLDQPEEAQRDEGDEKKAKWRLEREAFKQAMQCAKKIDAIEKNPDLNAEEARAQIADLTAQIPSQVDDDSRKQCPHCQRWFSAAAAERHIPKCAKAAHRPKPPPTKEEIDLKAKLRKSRIRLSSPRLSASQGLASAAGKDRKLRSPQRERTKAGSTIKVFQAETSDDERKREAQVTAMVENAEKRQPAIVSQLKQVEEPQTKPVEIVKPKEDLYVEPAQSNDYQDDLFSPTLVKAAGLIDRDCIDMDDLENVHLPVIDQRPSTVEFQDLEKFVGNLPEELKYPEGKKTEITAFRAANSVRRARNDRRKKYPGADATPSEQSGINIPSYAQEILSPTGPKTNPGRSSLLERSQQFASFRCQYCGKRFSEKAGRRHVEHCEKQYMAAEMDIKKSTSRLVRPSNIGMGTTSTPRAPGLKSYGSAHKLSFSKPSNAHAYQRPESPGVRSNRSNRSSQLSVRSSGAFGAKMSSATRGSRIGTGARTAVYGSAKADQLYQKYGSKGAVVQSKRVTVRLTDTKSSSGAGAGSSKFCTSCGWQFADGSMRFCGECGAKRA